MIRHFQPAWRKYYGVSRQRWKRLSGLEKTKLIKKYRDTVFAETLAFNLRQDDYKAAIPFSGPFIPEPVTERDYDPNQTDRGPGASVACEDEAYF